MPTVAYAKLEFEVHEAGLAPPILPSVGGVYVFVAEATILYVGQSPNLSTALANSSKWEEAVGREVTHIHVWEEPEDPLFDRLLLERLLIDKYRPILNPPLYSPVPGMDT